MSLFAEPEFKGETSGYQPNNPLYQAKLPSSLQIANLQVADLKLPDLQVPDLQVPCSAIAPAFAAADAGAIVLASLLGAAGYQLLISGAVWNPQLHVGAGVTAALLYLLIGKSFGFYHVTDVFSSRHNASGIVWQWLSTGLLLSLLAFLFRIGADFSRGFIICFAGMALASLLASRGLMKAALTLAIRQGRVQGRRVVLIGLREELASVGRADLLRRFGLSEIERIAFPNHGNWSLAANKGVLQSLDRALAVARDRGAEEIVLALGWDDTLGIELVRDKLHDSPLPVQLLPDRRVRYLTDNPAFAVKRSLAIEIQGTPLSGLEQAAKRAMDIVVASLALAVLSPLMLLTALAIRLESPGPALFRQQRSGFNAKRFLIFKFRTMTVMEEGDNVIQARPQDPRLTGLGGLLRACSVDELPQLFNVLLGDMSLVGPRPHALAHDSYYGKLLFEYAFRHHVKPGITGWAQVHGCRGPTDQVGLMKRRLDFDLWYINNWSLGLDLLVLARTVVELLRRRNAY
jgi:undecaprenyl-phosphate galactose phosphotransferase/putative colanic acid biosynthesis UDP-glucose lipid carrier transferase